LAAPAPARGRTRCWRPPRRPHRRRLCTRRCGSPCASTAATPSCGWCRWCSGACFWCVCVCVCVLLRLVCRQWRAGGACMRARHATRTRERCLSTHAVVGPRHGARTPLSDEDYLWGEAEWNVGGQPYQVRACVCSCGAAGGRARRGHGISISIRICSSTHAQPQPVAPAQHARYKVTPKQRHVSSLAHVFTCTCTRTCPCVAGGHGAR
jgi:hypothetical protein